jgi:hypothetical protein
MFCAIIAIGALCVGLVVGYFGSVSYDRVFEKSL